MKYLLVQIGCLSFAGSASLADVSINLESGNVYESAIEESKNDRSFAIGWNGGGGTSSEAEIRDFVSNYRDILDSNSLSFTFFYKHDSTRNGRIVGAVAGMPLVKPNDMGMSEFMNLLGGEALRISDPQKQSRITLFRSIFEVLNEDCNDDPEKCSERDNGRSKELLDQNRSAYFSIYFEDISTILIQSCFFKDEELLTKAVNKQLERERYAAMDRGSIFLDDFRLNNDNACTRVNIKVEIEGGLETEYAASVIRDTATYRDFFLEIDETSRLIAAISALEELASENEQTIRENEAELERLQKTEDVLEKLLDQACGDGSSNDAACNQ